MIRSCLETYCRGNPIPVTVAVGQNIDINLTVEQMLNMRANANVTYLWWLGLNPNAANLDVDVLANYYA
jgi:hypothetical protein